MKLYRDLGQIQAYNAKNQIYNHDNNFLILKPITKDNKKWYFSEAT